MGTTRSHSIRCLRIAISAGSNVIASNAAWAATMSTARLIERIISMGASTTVIAAMARMTVTAE